MFIILRLLLLGLLLTVLPSDVESSQESSSDQTTCFQDIPIYRSNSPYAVQKRGDLICVAHERATENGDYQQSINDTRQSARSLNTESSVSSPLGTPITLTQYGVGTSIFRYIAVAGGARSSYYSLPVRLFNSRSCSGSQPITYLNDFTSSCRQTVTQKTCDGTLAASQYTATFCLMTLPSSLVASTPARVCCSGTGATTSFASGTCSNALKTLEVVIYYSNPAGLTSCSFSLTSVNAPVNTVVDQTFKVTFLQTGSTAPTTPSRSGNPGYLYGSPLLAGNANGNQISKTDLTMLKASSSRDCSGTNRVPIRFGQNVQSLCQFTSTTCPSRTDLQTIFGLASVTDLYMGVYGNADPSNVTGHWVRVTSCTSEIGSSSPPDCQPGFLPNPSATQCYMRLDIQIAYANIGSVTNPQPVLGAVVFHYQRTTTLTSPLLISQSVTFQDVSAAPATNGDRIARPNVRIPGDFFYPLSLNRAATSVSCSSRFSLLMLLVCARLYL